MPELTHEVKIWKENEAIYHRLLNLEWMRAEMYRGLDADSTQPPVRDVLLDVCHVRFSSADVCC